MIENLATIPDDRRLELEREFDAPRDLVWMAFADPYHLSQWWGPKGFTNPVCELDLRPGGKWHHVMRGPDGREYPTDSVFIEVTPPERIVYRNAAASDAVLKKKLNDAGIDVLQSSPKEMAKYLASETAKWDKVIKAANIELQL